MAKIARHTPTLTGQKRIRAVSVDTALLPDVSDAITLLTSDWVWKQVGSDVAEIVQSCKDIVESWYSNMLVGSVTPWLSTPPAGWLPLDGSTHDGDDYPELFAVLDDVLKSGTDFTLPDVGEAFTFGVNARADAGVVEGDNVLNLTVGQLPSHNHTYIPPVLSATAETPVVPVPSVAVGGSTTTGSTGDGDDIDKRPKRFGLIFAVFAGRT